MITMINDKYRQDVVISYNKHRREIPMFAPKADGTKHPTLSQDLNTNLQLEMKNQIKIS